MTLSILKDSPIYVRSAGHAMRLARKVTLAPIEYDRAAVATMTNAQVKRLAADLTHRKTVSSDYLFTVDQIKIGKSNKQKLELNIVMHLAPGKNSRKNTCPDATPGCLASCLYLSGKGRLSNVMRGRILKTLLFFEHREVFLRLMHDELAYWVRRASKLGLGLAGRPNGTSDVPWETVAPEIFVAYPDVQFYDYTKSPQRIGKQPANYHLTLSKSEKNQVVALRHLREGGNIAIVFSDYKKALREGWAGFPGVDGVANDRRYNDPAGHFVALAALGEAKHDSTGFVVHN